MKKSGLLIVVFSLLTIVLATEKKMNYDTSSAYKAIEDFFGQGGYEVPDGCPDNYTHIRVQKDASLSRNVFVHTLHRTTGKVDTDRCTKTDRQRAEVAVSGRSQSWMKGYNGSTFSYAWKLYLPSNFAVSGQFCHLHQIKYDGSDVGYPNLTLTARKHMQLQNNDDKHILASIPLGDFLGYWVQIRQVITFGSNGHVQFLATRIKDGAKLLDYNGKADLVTNGYMTRPKFGFYRHLSNADGLKNQQIKLVDICIGTGDSCHYNAFGVEIKIDQINEKFLTKQQ